MMHKFTSSECDKRGLLQSLYSLITSCVKYTLLQNLLHTSTSNPFITLFMFSGSLHREQLVALGLQLCQLARDKVPLEGCVLAPSSQRDVFGEAVVAAPSSSFTLPSLSDLPILAHLPSGLRHPLLTLACRRRLVCCSSSSRSFRLLLGSPVGGKAIPETRAPSGSRRLLRLYCKWTENSEKVVGLILGVKYGWCFGLEFTIVNCLLILHFILVLCSWVIPTNNMQAAV